MAETPFYKGFLLFSSLPSFLPFLSHISPVIPTFSRSVKGVVMGGIWERYGRDKNYLSHAETPIYKGISEDDGRDGEK